MHALVYGFGSALLPPDPDTDPNFVMAQQFATQHGFHIAYRRDINCSNALFNTYEGVVLVVSEIRTGAGSDVDRHYIAYLAATCHVLDNKPGGKVPVVKAVKVIKECRVHTLEMWGLVELKKPRDRIMHILDPRCVYVKHYSTHYLQYLRSIKPLTHSICAVFVQYPAVFLGGVSAVFHSIRIVFHNILQYLHNTCSCLTVQYYSTAYPQVNLSSQSCCFAEWNHCIAVTLQTLCWALGRHFTVSVTCFTNGQRIRNNVV